MNKPAPSDTDLRNFMIGALPRGVWLRKVFICETVNRRNWTSIGHSSPSWYQCKRVLRELISLGIVEYLFVRQGWFQYHAYRLRPPQVPDERNNT